MNYTDVICNLSQPVGTFNNIKIKIGSFEYSYENIKFFLRHFCVKTL